MSSAPLGILGFLQACDTAAVRCSSCRVLVSVSADRSVYLKQQDGGVQRFHKTTINMLLFCAWEVCSTLSIYCMTLAAIKFEPPMGLYAADLLFHAA